MGLFRNFLKRLIKISRPVFSFDDGQLIFKIESDRFYNYTVDNFEVKTRHDSYVNEAYTVSTDSLYLEYINTIGDDVNWSASPSSLFLDLMKEKMNIKKMEVLESYEFKHYDFAVYKLDNEILVNYIYVSDMDKEVFIMDLDGELYTHLISHFVKSYKYEYEKNKKSNFNLNFSLVKKNSLFNYFSYGD